MNFICVQTCVYCDIQDIGAGGNGDYGDADGDDGDADGDDDGEDGDDGDHDGNGNCDYECDGDHGDGIHLDFLMIRVEWREDTDGTLVQLRE